MTATELFHGRDGAYEIIQRSWLLLVAPLAISSASAELHAVDQQLRCGAYCLYVAAKLFEAAPPSFAALEEQIGSPGTTGHTAELLCESAHSLGLEAILVRTSADRLVNRSERFACIACLGQHRFVLLATIENDRVAVIDPPRTYTLPLATLNSQWNGDAVLIADAPLESEESLRRRMNWYQTLTRVLAVMGAVVLTLASISIARRRWRLRRT